MTQISLGELAIELKMNKSKLSYYFTLGLIKPVATVGRMNVFDRDSTIKIIKAIEKSQKDGKSLKEIKNQN